MAHIELVTYKAQWNKLENYGSILIYGKMGLGFRKHLYINT